MATQRKFQGVKWPGNERARQRVGQGANRLEFYWPIRSGERIGPGAKRLGTKEIKQLLKFRQCTNTALREKTQVSPFYQVVQKRKLIDVAQ